MRNSFTSVFPNIRVGNSKNEIKQRNKRRRLEEDVSMGKSTAGTKEKRSPDRLNYSNQNAIIINIIS